MKFLNLRYEFDWGIPFKEPFLGWMINGVKFTLLIAAVTTVASLIIGTVVALMRNSRFRIFRIPATIYVEIVRNVSGLFWVLFFYYVVPHLLPFGLGDICNRYTHYGLIAGILGLTVDNSSYVSDIVSTGLMGIPRGRIEAAVSTGFNRFQQIRYIVLPDAFRMMLPPLTVRMINNFKNSSICMIVAVQELTWATQEVESITFRGIETTFVATAFYVVLALSIAAIMLRLERHLKIDIASVKSLRT